MTTDIFKVLGTCNVCPLSNAAPVFGQGVLNSYMIIGEAPGIQEHKKGQPFIGPSGQLLRQTLKAVGLDPDAFWYTNACLCRPDENKTPVSSAWSACGNRLQTEIAHVQPTKILTVGSIGLSALKRASKSIPITKERGRGYYALVGPEQRPVYTVSTYHPAALLRDPDLFPDFSDDIWKFAHSDVPVNFSIETVVPDNPREVLEYLRMLSGASSVSCDIETTGFSPIRDRLLSVGFGAITVDGSGFSLIIHQDLLKDLMVKEHMRLFLAGVSFPGTLVFHNAKFDSQFLIRYYGDLTFTPNLADTMLMHYTLDERPMGKYASHGLKPLSRTRYDAANYSFDFKEFFKAGYDLTDTHHPKLREMYEYQGKDCIYTARLYEDINKEMMEESPHLRELHDQVLLPGTMAFGRAELHGVLLDIPYFEELKVKLEDEFEEHISLAQKLVGNENLNPKSPKQVAEILYKQFGLTSKTNSTDKNTLKALLKVTDGEQAEFIRTLLEIRQIAKTLRTYVVGLLNKVDPDGRIRSDFLIHGTATGRLSSQRPNLQNIPKRQMGKLIRDGFIVPEGYSFIECDYSQLEFRIAAWFSQDPSLVETFCSGKDLHTSVACKMFGKQEDDVTEQERYLAKCVNFGILYGRGATSLVEGQEMEHLESIGGTRWTVGEAQSYINTFLKQYPHLQHWVQQQHRRVSKERFVETPLGRRRRFPLTLTGGHHALMERQSVNAPIQSLASDLCLSALARLQKTLPEGAYVLFSIHDAINFEVRDDLIPEVISIIRYEMEQNIPIPSKIPFTTEMKIGKRWGTLKKVEY